MVDATQRTSATARTLALVGLVAEALPILLPLYGDGDQFLFSLGFPARSVIAQYLSGLAIPFTVGVGLVLLRRGSDTLAAGVLLGLGLVIAFGVVSMLIIGTDVLTRWQSALVICLRGVAAGALLAAATMVTRRVGPVRSTRNP
jgi:hypothetical protein